jgi:hypothetical protein
MASSFACPCCRFLTLLKPAAYHLCPVCFWIDDGRADASLHSYRGRRVLSLAEARANFSAFGASEPGLGDYVRPPRREELRAESN